MKHVVLVSHFWTSTRRPPERFRQPGTVNFPLSIGLVQGYVQDRTNPGLISVGEQQMGNPGDPPGVGTWCLLFAWFFRWRQTAWCSVHGCITPSSVSGADDLRRFRPSGLGAARVDLGEFGQSAGPGGPRGGGQEDLGSSRGMQKATQRKA